MGVSYLPQSEVRSPFNQLAALANKTPSSGDLSQTLAASLTCWSLSHCQLEAAPSSVRSSLGGQVSSPLVTPLCGNHVADQPSGTCKLGANHQHRTHAHCDQLRTGVDTPSTSTFFTPANRTAQPLSSLPPFPVSSPQPQPPLPPFPLFPSLRERRTGASRALRLSPHSGAAAPAERWAGLGRGRGNGGGGAGGVLTPVSATRSLQSLRQLESKSPSPGSLAARAWLSRARSHGGLHRDLRRQRLRELGRDPLGQGAEVASGPVPDPRRAAPPNCGE